MQDRESAQGPAAGAAAGAQEGCDATWAPSRVMRCAAACAVATPARRLLVGQLLAW
jgi:hypothetical protein